MTIHRINPETTSTRPAKADASANAIDANRITSSTVEPVSTASPLQNPKDGDMRKERIAACAYQLAEQRGFAPGQELDDWLTAEREIDANPTGS